MMQAIKAGLLGGVVGVFTLSASADVLLVSTVDTQGNAAAYVERLQPLMARLQELNPEAEVEVFRADYAGPAVARLYIVIRTPTAAAAAAVGESVNADDEYQRLLQRLADTGRNLESRVWLTQIALE